MKQIFAVTILLLAACALVGTTPGRVLADTNAAVAAALTSHDTYISPSLPPAAHVRRSDARELENAVVAASSDGVSEKLALVSHYPTKYTDTYQAADALRQYLDLAGTLVLVSPTGIGVASDSLNLNEIRSIETRARPRCLVSYAGCAVYAGQLATSQVKADEASANRSAATFWLVLLGILAVIIVAVVFLVRRRRGTSSARLEELRAAASTTLAVADSTVENIESSGSEMPATVRRNYDGALALRDRASTALQRAGTPGALTQANQDAAAAVLALQGVAKALGLQASNPLEMESEHRCFYCARTDRPPYTVRTIDDGKGNSMEIEVCSVCLQTLQQGQTPQLQSVRYNGTNVPWWAIPTSPWYYGYGGATWQYWLPFMIGMDAGTWFDGGWGGYGGGWGGDGGFDTGGISPGVGGDISGNTVDPSTDYGAGDFSGWGDTGGDASSTDLGNWGGDAGAGDWGGDSGGGGDWGGGDSGGGW